MHDVSWSLLRGARDASFRFGGLFEVALSAILAQRHLSSSTLGEASALSRFATLAAPFLQEQYEDSPVHATALGVAGYDSRLDDLRQETFERRRADDARWLAELSSLGPSDVDDSERIDHRYLVSTLRGRTVMADWATWRRQPAVYLSPGLTGVHLLYLRRTLPPEELHRAAEARLGALPWNLLEGKRNLDAALVAPIFVERGIGQARAGARYVRDLLPLEAEGTWRQRLAIAGENAAVALLDFADWLESLRGAASGDHAIGAERYTALLRERELLPYDADELLALGEELCARYDGELRAIAKRIDPSRDWRDLMTDLRRDRPQTPDAMRDAYEEAASRARAFVLDRGLVTLPEGERCIVEPLPPFQRPVQAVASYSGPPAFSRSLVGHFFVPYPPDGTPPEEVAERLAPYGAIQHTAVHEAYPGHHVQRVIRVAHPSAVRKSFANSFFAEGWALYAERMMREQGFFADPRAELNAVRSLFFRAIRIVVDVRLHTRRMQFDDAVRFLMDRALMSAPNARTEAGRYCAGPVQASSYMVGHLEVAKLRDRFLRERGLSGVAGLRAFHDRLLSGGDLPLALAAEEVLASPTRPPSS